MHTGRYEASIMQVFDALSVKSSQKFVNMFVEAGAFNSDGTAPNA
jgi:hypothetical protein